MYIRTLEEHEVETDFDTEPETVPYVGNCSAIDPKTDRKREEWIRQQLAEGNESAWCRVTVTVRWGTRLAMTSLGGCSAESSKDLINQCYDDLVQQALDNLNEDIERAIYRDLPEIPEDLQELVITPDPVGKENSVQWSRTALYALQLHDVLEDLIEWDDHMGGRQGRVWQRAKNLLAAIDQDRKEAQQCQPPLGTPE